MCGKKKKKAMGEKKKLLSVFEFPDSYLDAKTRQRYKTRALVKSMNFSVHDLLNSINFVTLKRLISTAE